MFPKPGMFQDFIHSFLVKCLADRHKVLFCGVLLNLLMHLPFVNLPPQSLHVWRQCHTLAVARNFATEDMNILRPRVDFREDKDGVTGMQFPSYEWGLAWLLKAFGEGYWVHRTYSLLIFFAGAFAFGELLFLLTGSAVVSSLGSWTFLWVPELFYWGFSALPDVLALACALGGMVFFLKWMSSFRVSHALSALLLLTLGGLTKIQYLMVGVPLVVLVFQSPKIRRDRWIQALLAAGGVLGVTLAWYAYARWLIRVSGVKQFGIEVASFPSPAKAAGAFLHSFYSQLPELLMGYPSFLLGLVGAWMVWREKKDTGTSRRMVFWGSWAGVALLWHVLEIGKVQNHPYYLIPWVPVLAVLTVRGALALLTPRRVPWLLLLLLLQPIAAGLRIIPPRWLAPHPEIPAEFADPGSLQKLRGAVPEGALCLVGPDESPSVYLYFLHKKGFVFKAMKSLAPKEKEKGALEGMIEKGGAYLYVNDPRVPTQPFVAPYLAGLVLREGNFEVYKLGLPPQKRR